MAIIGIGTTVKHGAGSAATAVPKVKKCNLLDFTIDKIDTTNLDNSTFIKTNIPGMIDPQDVVCEAEYVSATYETLMTMFLARSITVWAIQTPIVSAASTTATFDGYISKLSQPIESTAEMTFEFTITPTGDNITIS